MQITTVKELKEAIKDLDDNLKIHITAGYRKKIRLYTDFEITNLGSKVVIKCDICNY